MDLSDMDMKKEFENYNMIAPEQIAKLSVGEFKYRYYKNPNPKVNATIVMLAGGSGMADGFFSLAKVFMDNYSFISFNYPMEYKGNEKTADAIAELIKYLKAENVYYWGQSYGGLIAQIIAKNHPEVVKGLILTSTASLSNDIRFEGMECFVGMINEKKEQKRYKTYKKFPMFLLPVMMNLAFKKYLKDKPGASKSVKELMRQLKPVMTKEYFCHMTSLLGDLRNYIGTHHKEDFEFLIQIKVMEDYLSYLKKGFEKRIVGFDDIPICNYMNPPLTTVQVPKRFYGETAAVRIIQLVENKNNQPLKIEVNTKLVRMKTV